jgi:PKHD-type hydroxylase
MNDSISVIENFLSIEECTYILNKCKNELILSNAMVYDNNHNISNAKTNRKSSVAWIDDLEFLNDRLKDKLKTTFNINGMEVSGLGSFQFTEYKMGDYFGWHIDSNATIYKDRFASTVIQLNDDYTDGIFEIKNLNGDLVSIENKIGSLYIFNSNLVHQVTPVKSGIRYSLVNWVSLVKLPSAKQSLI